MKINFNNPAQAKISKKFFEKIAKTFYHSNNISSDYEVSVALIKNRDIKRLNKMYRGIDRPTDVLSFSEKDGTLKMPMEEKSLGEVIISYQEAVKQAKLQKHSIKDELRTLFVHGLAHLVGYGHNTNRERKRMEELEKRVLRLINVKCKNQK